MLDVYAPAGAKSLPVIFWIHVGGWQSGDRNMVALKPKALIDAGLVFVSLNHRLLPAVHMETITRDVARPLGWVHKNIATHTAVTRPDRWSWATPQAGSSRL